jgi:hypothetical protein
MVLWGGGGSFKRWGLVGGLQVIGGKLLKELVGLQPLSPFLFLTIR